MIQIVAVPPKVMNPTMFLQIGRRRYEVASFRDASEMFCAARDKSGFGASQMPIVAVVTDSGRELARVSYNGRVWAAGGYRPDAVPLYDNRA